MNFILKKNWLIDNLNFMISNNRYGYYFQFKPSFYDYWIKKSLIKKAYFNTRGYIKIFEI